MRTIVTALIATMLFLVAVTWWRNTHEHVVIQCNTFKNGQTVEVLAGFNEGATGTVLKSLEKNSYCFYKIRGQRGVEMPFVRWYWVRELQPAGE